MDLDCTIDRGTYNAVSKGQPSLTEADAVQIRSDLESELHRLNGAVNDAVDALQPREDALAQSLIGGANLLAGMSPDAWRSLVRQDRAYDELQGATQALEDFMLEAFPQLETAYKVDSQRFVGNSEVSHLYALACHALSNATAYGRSADAGSAWNIAGLVEGTDHALTGLSMLHASHDVPVPQGLEMFSDRFGLVASGIGFIGDVVQIQREGLTLSAGFSLAASAGGVVVGIAAAFGATVPGAGAALLAAEVVSAVLEHEEQKAMLQTVVYDTLTRAGMPDALATQFSESRLDGILALREAGLTNAHIYDMAWKESSVLKTPADALLPLTIALAQRPDALAQTLRVADTEAFPAGNIARGLLELSLQPRTAAEFADLLEKFDHPAFVQRASPLIDHLRSLD